VSPHSPQQQIPWTPLAKPLGDCRVALVSSAGIARHDQPPFDQELERRDPWWSDQSWRPIPTGTSEADVAIYHLHIDPRFGHHDLDCVLPLRRLRELAADGLVGEVTATHYSSWATSSSPPSCFPPPPRPSPPAWPRRRSMWPCWCRCDRFVAGRSDWSSE
jgi:Glycine/sarcosine/betaine reductase selenoprotein B (GRDB)